jgi:hypothetical protein
MDAFSSDCHKGINVGVDVPCVFIQLAPLQELRQAALVEKRDV